MSTFSAIDYAYMARALKLAWRGRYGAHPNPRVGCVMVRDETVVGAGWHALAVATCREIMPPTEAPGQYWLEAIPKTKGDRANFQQVTIILDEEEFLPLAILVYPPNYTAQRNPARTSYHVHQRTVDDVIHRGQEFFNQFNLLVWENIPQTRLRHLQQPTKCANYRVC